MIRNQDKRLDPVCGMRLNTEQTVISYTYIGWTYAFCSRECFDLFIRAPEHFVAFLAHEPKGHLGHLCPGQRGEGTNLRTEQAE